MSAALQALAYSHICFILNSYLPTFLKLYHRLMLGLSFSDLVMSSSYFFSSWAVPKGTDGVFSPLGNTATCNAQAFFMQYGVSTPIYNVALSFYFMFIVRLQWPERKCVEYEKWFHGGK